MMERDGMVLAIYCAGGLGRQIMEFAMDINSICHRWDAMFFVDDIISEQKVMGLSVYRFESCLETYKKYELEFVIASGEPFGRKALYEKLKGKNLKLTNLISSAAKISPYARIGEGIIMMGPVSVNSGVSLADNLFLDAATIVGHDVIIGNNTVLSGNVFIGGETKIGDNVYIGPGSLVKDRIEIREGAILSMGSVVYRNVKKDKIVMGNPARILGDNVNHKVFGGY